MVRRHDQKFLTQKCVGFNIVDTRTLKTWWFCCCDMELTDFYDTTFFIGGEEE